MALPDYGSKKQMPILGAQNANPWASAGFGTTAEEEGSTQPLTDAERARTVVSNNRIGTLSVVVGDGGAAIGFVLPYAVDASGNPFLAVGEGVERTGRFSPGMAASLAVAESPLTAGVSGSVSGTTLLGKLMAVTAENQEEAILNYSRVHSSEGAMVKRGAARLYAFTSSAVLVTMATGAVASLPIADYFSASADPLAGVAPGLVAHLSGDQTGSLVLLCKAFGGQPATTAATLTGLDYRGLDIVATTPSGQQSVRIGWNHPVANPEDVRRELNVMVRGARFKLGMG